MARTKATGRRRKLNNNSKGPNQRSSKRLSEKLKRENEIKTEGGAILEHQTKEGNQQPMLGGEQQRDEELDMDNRKEPEIKIEKKSNFKKNDSQVNSEPPKEKPEIKIEKKSNFMKNDSQVISEPPKEKPEIIEKSNFKKNDSQVISEPPKEEPKTESVLKKRKLNKNNNQIISEPPKPKKKLKKKKFQKKDNQTLSPPEQVEDIEENPNQEGETLELTEEDNKKISEATLEMQNLGIKSHPFFDMTMAFRAVKALKTNLDNQFSEKPGKKKMLDLFPRNPLYVAVTLNYVPKKVLRPFWIPLNRTLRGDDTDICVFVRDGDKDDLKSKNLPNVKKIITVSTLRKKYYQFESRRKLAGSFNLFLCDQRICRLLPRLLGKNFYSKPYHRPITVNLQFSPGDVIARARDCTFLYIPQGTSLSVPAAGCDFSVKEIMENVWLVLDAISKMVKGIQSVQICHGKLFIPIYRSLPTN